MNTSAPAAPVAVPEPAAGLAYPLNEFYAREGVPLPAIEAVPGDAIPEPFRSLLVHDRDMTPTLEAFHRSDIHIEVWGRERRGDFYFREVVLRLDRDQRPVEFGANKIHLALFAPAVRRLILDEYLPLGHILQMCRVPHAGHPLGYFRIQSDPLMHRAFGLAGSRTLYGRRNTIRDPNGQPLSEVVEILPPV